MSDESINKAEEVINSKSGCNKKVAVLIWLAFIALAAIILVLEYQKKLYIQSKDVELKEWLDNRITQESHNEALFTKDLMASQQVKTVNMLKNEFLPTINNQTSVIHRALGKVLPITLPDSAENEFSEINKVLRSEAAWSMSVDAVQALADKQETQFNKLPVWVQYEVAPKIAPRRWEIAALLVIIEGGQEHDSIKSKNEYLLSIEAVLGNQPVGTDVIFEERLEKIFQRVEVEVSEGLKRLSYSAADEALRTGEKISQAMSGLNEYFDDKSKDYKQKLQKRFDQELLESQYTKVMNRLADARKIEESKIQLLALDEVHKDLLTLRYKIIVGKIDVPNLIIKIKQREVEILTQIESTRDKDIQLHRKRLKEYQQDAIIQLKKFQSRYLTDQLSNSIQTVVHGFKNPVQPITWELLKLTPDVANDIRELTGVELNGAIISIEQQAVLYSKLVGDTKTSNGFFDTLVDGVSKGLNEATDGLINEDKLVSSFRREGMIKYMSSINPNYLELPVSNIYRKYYSRSFDKLEPDDQWVVAETFTSTVKMELGE